MGPLSLVILKVTARCNLNCSYCYEFNLGDTTWKASPPFMSERIFHMALDRILEHCLLTGQKSIRLSLHGGEPCLHKPSTIDRWCDEARRRLGPLVVRFALQTNGTLIDDEWIEVFQRQGIDIGISLDGPPEVNDTFRIDHAGRGTHEKIVRGIRLLLDGDVAFGILTVMSPGSNSLAIHRHFVSLGCRSISYLYPDYNHDNADVIKKVYGKTPFADYLIPIFEEWWFNETLDVRVRNFWEMSRLILGGKSQIDALGNMPLGFCVVAANGDIEGLDVLKGCANGFTKTGVSVVDGSIADVARRSPEHAKMIFDGAELPDACKGCPEAGTCAGGYHPHRYSKSNGFNNSSVWCADLLKLFGHIRERLGVGNEETQRLQDKYITRVALAEASR